MPMFTIVGGVNGAGFRVVAFYRNGELLPATDTPPAWLVQLRQELG